MKHIPNLLSYFRILLIPVFVWQMFMDHGWNAALVLGLSGLTDLLDGFLARRFNWVSDLGKVLDPVADKMTQVVVCIVLAMKMQAYWFFFAILLLKEVVMLAIGGYLVKNKIKIEGAKWFGKVVTSLFYISMIAIVFIPSMPEWLVTALLTLTTLCALTAAFLYIPEFRKYKEEAKEQKNLS